MSEIGTSEPLPAVPEFEAFYEAVNGRAPFPWQRRLAQAVASATRWPEEAEEIGVPTGLGKTACLDIAIWWLASQAHLPGADRTAPTRIWWVVNRRLLVDSTFDHAERIGTMLSNALNGSRGTSALPDALHSVARRLRSLAVDSRAEPLEVIRLRGGAAWGRPTDPSQPAVILSTIPMYGSRLLFRGYGSSRSMRPVDAALAGTDSLVLVDEAHLADHLVRLFPALQECAPWRRCVLNRLRAAPRVVALTATGNAGKERFELDEDDEKHSEIKRRLDAAKPTRIRVSDKPDQVAQLADAAASLLDEAGKPATCVIFVNAPATARAVRHRLLKAVKTDLDRDDIVVLTGQTREREARVARQRILDGMRAGRTEERRSRHLVVVATQTLEVGADIDAEFLVTEACGVRALTQRMGRVNRLGGHPNAQAIYVHCAPKGRRAGDGWPVYGAEPEEVLKRLRAAAEDGVVNLSPRRVAGVLGEPGDDPGRAPEILPAILGEWIKTTTPPNGEAPVEPYFSGISRPEFSASVTWRAHVPGPGERLWPRPTESEFVEAPIGALRDALGGGDELIRIGSDRVTVEAVRLDELRPGDQLVLPTDRGLLDADGWAPDSNEPVADVSILQHGLPLEVEALRRLCDDPARDGDRLSADSVRRWIRLVIGEVEGHDEVGDSERTDALDELLDHLREHPPPALNDSDYDEASLSGWTEFISELDSGLPAVGARREVPHLRRLQDRSASRVDELDEVSLAVTATDLESHGSEVGTRAGRVAAVLGVSPDVTATMERAGSFHDVGKADDRFQRWLDPTGTTDSGGPLVAKSAMPPQRWSAARAAAGWPLGGRHEDLSARLVRQWLTTTNGGFDSEMADLLVHLVISHHGKGRPLVPAVEDGTSAVVAYELDGIEVSCSADLSEIDWAQPARFKRLNDLFGPWGLALLEAIVRQADHAVSAGSAVRELEVL